MADIEVILPKMGESVAEATITTWLKSVGDTIKEDESIVEIATDKVDSEVPSPASGIIKEILFKEGDVVEVGKVIVIIGNENFEEKSVSSNNNTQVAQTIKEDTIEENVVEKVKELVGDFMDEASIESFAQLVWKYKLPVAAVVAVLYGGKKLKDYMAGEEDKGNTTINNYYGSDQQPATENQDRIRHLAGIKTTPTLAVIKNTH